VRAGICSVTLRVLDVDGVLRVATDAGLRCVEWGGDVHVPAGDLAKARRVRRDCANAGIAIASYGSYYRAGTNPEAAGQAALDTAAELGAARVRVWAGSIPSAAATEEERAGVTAALARLAAQAADRGLAIALEYHGDTLTDDRVSALRLLRDADSRHLSLYWQPPLDLPDEAAVADALAIMPHASALHVFSWFPGQTRRELHFRQAMWQPVIAAAAAAGISDALLEFVPGDDPALVAREAGTLSEWIRRAQEA
jgi:sugar phosphate isomerase/epimerase